MENEIKECPDNFITPEFINSLEPLKFEGPITMITTESELEELIQLLSRQEAVGFDTESRPSFTKGQNYPISLLQFATADAAYIVQLRKTGFTNNLAAFFESDTLKIGVGLKDDIRKLQDERAFKPGGMVDLSEIARKKGHHKSSLRALSACFLNKRIIKSAQKTNWARDVLTDKQLCYAATDAWACLLLYPFLQNYRGIPNKNLGEI